MRYRILWVIGAAAALILTLMILGAKPKSALPGICIYEVSISALINTINIGWTLSPCQDLDIREIDDYHRLIHSSFQPMCPVYSIQTWRDKQGPLLAAVQMETMILNVLLFLIIAVAGFGILAIFFMIVVEKTKDIGILKSLGAGSGGIAGIFVAYGMSLGAVGAGAGMACGLLFVKYINQIAGWLGWLTGHKIFDPEIYYFYEIPTNVNPLTVAWIVAGALLIAVGASVLPACRAARFHPVEALRYE